MIAFLVAFLATASSAAPASSLSWETLGPFAAYFGLSGVIMRVLIVKINELLAENAKLNVALLDLAKESLPALAASTDMIARMGAIIAENTAMLHRLTEGRDR